MELLILGGSVIFALALMIFLFVRFALVVVTVHSQSMSPTLEDGDRVLVWRNWPAAWLRKGQIAIVWPYATPCDGPMPFGVAAPYIKRITALPGETVTTSITELQELLHAQQQALYDSTGRREWHIPAGQVFVKGDFPYAVADSRVWGPIPVQGVLGVVIMKLARQAKLPRTEMPVWPMDTRGKIEDGPETV